MHTFMAAGLLNRGTHYSTCQYIVSQIISLNHVIVSFIKDASTCLNIETSYP